MLGLFYLGITVATLTALILVTRYSFRLEQQFHLLNGKEGKNV